MKRSVFKTAFAVVFSAMLAGCGGGGGDESVVASDDTVSQAQETVLRENSLPKLDDAAFNALKDSEKIYVAKKIYATLYKGKSPEDLRQEIDSGRFLSRLKSRLHREGVAQPDRQMVFVDDYEIPYDARAGDRLFEKRWRIFAQIASNLYYTRLGKAYYDAWIAYVLSQTILFSPAYEVDSVKPFPELIYSGYSRLREALSANLTIREVVYGHMVSKENWARFRSPEDNGREMLEIWLYDYEDAHVPLAAKALKNWRWELRRERNGSGVYGDVYRFYNDTNNLEEINDEPVEILGRSVTTGEDFYRMVANHPKLLATVTDRLVNLFYPTFPAERKAWITQAILSSEPRTFQDIFDQILFSKAYLLESDRIRTIEEIFMPLAQQMGMHPDGTTFRYLMTRGMEPAAQAPFLYKLGRLDEGESNTDSVIRMHRYIRDAVFLNRSKGGIAVGELMKRYESDGLEGYLNNMFLDVTGREMTEDEKETLLEIVREAGIGVENAGHWDRFAVLLMVFDYFSRLSEIYTYRKIDGGGVS
jgi:hypothetical protein